MSPTLHASRFTLGSLYQKTVDKSTIPLFLASRLPVFPPARFHASRSPIFTHDV